MEKNGDDFKVLQCMLVISLALVRARKEYLTSTAVGWYCSSFLVTSCTVNIFRISL